MRAPLPYYSTTVREVVWMYRTADRNTTTITARTKATTGMWNPNISECGSWNPSPLASTASLRKLWYTSFLKVYGRSQCQNGDQLDEDSERDDVQPAPCLDQ